MTDAPLEFESPARHDPVHGPEGERNTGEDPQKSTARAWLKTLIIYTVAFAALVFVCRSTDFSAVTVTLAQAQLAWLLPAFLLFNAAQAVSALRMRFYCRLRGQDLNAKAAVALYYAGMFYNMVLPGGIGGDGYKILALKRHAGFPAREGLRTMLGERASGLLLLLGFLFALLPFSGVFNLLPWPWLWWGMGIVAALIGYRVGAWPVTGERLPHSLRAAWYSFVVQGLTLLAAWCLLEALGIESHRLDYLVLMLAAAVAGILPLTVGGIGLRELVYYLAAPEIGAPVEPAIAFSLTFFTLYFLASLLGLPALGGIGKLLKNNK